MSPPSAPLALQQPETSTSARRFIIISASTISLTGAVVLIGWIFHVPLLVRLQPHWASMKFNTALCFLALGVGMLLQSYRRPLATTWLARFTLAIAALTVSEYAFEIDLGLDDFFLKPFLVEPNVPPGRMSPVTALLFFCSALALALCSSRNAARLGSAVGALASIIGGVALAAVIGYGTGTPTTYGWGATTSVAFHTACSFVLVAATLATIAASASGNELPRWLPWTALLAGLACTFAVGVALDMELDPASNSLVPKVAIAIGFSLSLLAFLALHSQRRLGQQGSALAAALNTQKELFAERARLAAIVDSSNDAIISVDLGERIVVWNGAAERLFGYAPHEVLGKSLDAIVPPDTLNAAREATRQARAGISTQGLRTQRRHKHGRLIEIDVNVSPVRDTTGTIIGTAGIVRDLAAQLETQRMMQGILEAAPDAMVIADTAGNIVLVNDMTESLFGYPREELIGKTVEMLIPERFRAEHAGLRDRFVQAPARRQMGSGRELVALRHGNVEFPTEITLNHLLLPNRTLVVVAVRDITDKRAARRRLEDSLAEKELLLKEVHHRVKNNLQIVASMLSLQAEQLDEPRARMPLELCRQRVLSMALVHEKLYSGRDLRRIDLGELVREIATMLLSGEPPGRVIVSFSLDALNVDIETAFPASLMVNELITNAIKHAYNHRAGGTLAIAVHRLTHERGEITVADDGPGGVTNASLQSSTSLGSTIIRHLVRQLDGELRVESKPGTRITVSFPLRRVHAA